MLLFFFFFRWKLNLGKSLEILSFFCDWKLISWDGSERVNLSCSMLEFFLFLSRYSDSTFIGLLQVSQVILDLLLEVHLHTKAE